MQSWDPERIVSRLSTVFQYRTNDKLILMIRLLYSVNNATQTLCTPWDCTSMWLCSIIFVILSLVWLSNCTAKCDFHFFLSLLINSECTISSVLEQYHICATAITHCTFLNPAHSLACLIMLQYQNHFGGTVLKKKEKWDVWISVTFESSSTAT